MANLKDDLDERQTCPDENEGGLGLAIGAAATATAAAIALLVRTVKEDKSGLVKFYFEWRKICPDMALVLCTHCSYHEMNIWFLGIVTIRNILRT